MIFTSAPGRPADNYSATIPGRIMHAVIQAGESDVDTIELGNLGAGQICSLLFLSPPEHVQYLPYES